MKLESKTLEDIAIIIAGQSPPSSSYNSIGDGVPFFQGMADFNGKHPKIRFWCNKPTKISNPNDILISVRAPVGPVIINNVKACAGRGLGIIRVNENISLDYVYYFLRVNEKKISDLGVGSTFKAITQKNLRKIEIQIPELLADQIRIANILSQAELLIAQRKQSISLLDELLKSTFLDMFGDPMKVNKKWKKEACGNLFDMKLGKMLSAKNYTGTRLRKYLRNVNVKWGVIDLSNVKEMDFSEKEEESYNLLKGDILVCEGGDVGRTAILKTELENYCYQNALHRLRIKDQVKIDANYFSWYMYLGVTNGLIKKETTSVTIQHFTQDKFKKLLIPLPPIELQTKFATIVEKVEELKTQYQQSLVELQNMYGVLSQKAFKGELNLNQVTNEEVVLETTTKTKKYSVTDKAILAGHIINITNNEDFGRVKFQKLLYLTEHHCKLNLGSNYMQNVAGPYDGKLINEVESKLKHLAFYDINKSKTGRQINYTALGSAKQLENYFKDSFTAESKSIDALLAQFKKSTWEQTEIIATLYAVWNNRILKQETITDELLKKDFLNWDPQKKKYKDRLDVALQWMREKGIVPDGWGEVI